MYDYVSQISQFLQEHFVPADNAEQSNTRLTSEQLMRFLFKTFPEGCISDYELNEIMLKLKYKRETYTIEIPIEQTKEEKKSNAPIKYNYELCTGWCMNSLALKEKLTN